jgi:hypothetical protein
MPIKGNINYECDPPKTINQTIHFKFRNVCRSELILRSPKLPIVTTSQHLFFTVGQLFVCQTS